MSKFGFLHVELEMEFRDFSNINTKGHKNVTTKKFRMSRMAIG